ncbi:hypothetical protein SISNIDRAFT_390746, partial [Sistotremastrum niveocremeum HHB9708]
LQMYALTSPEWIILNQLTVTLQIFIDATHYVSRTKTPLLYQVIPLIDKLDSHLLLLMKINVQRPLHNTIRHAAHLARAVLNKYYSRTDESIMYRVAMVLHPRYKLEYFAHHEWEEDWIAEA